MFVFMLSVLTALTHKVPILNRINLSMLDAVKYIAC